MTLTLGARAVALLMLLLPASLPIAAAAAETPNVAAPAAPAITAPRVLFTRPGHEVPVVVEVCRTELEERVGYMLRLYVPPYSGMLFVMPVRRVQAFWMQNTVAPLDMIFVDEDRTVVGIVHNATPLTEDLRFVRKPSVFVVEVAAGFAKRTGIQVGDTVRFRGIHGL
ncbi:MAG: DUF192 domain-containing protein [Deltaproteobacteria bacterium]|nr:MAG: DUF192 domain-containing protein [Deltaproteobacteria bacterium]